MSVSLSFKKVVAFLSVIYYNPLVKNITLNDIFYNPLLIIYTPLEKPAAPLPAFLRPELISSGCNYRVILIIY